MLKPVRTVRFLVRQAGGAIRAVALGWALGPARARAAETRGDHTVVGGTVNGSKPVQGDVLAVGGYVTLQGPVGGNIRAASGTIVVNNTVTQDVAVAEGNATVGPLARVGRDLLSETDSTVVDGAIARNVVAGGGRLALNDAVWGNVHLTALRFNWGPRPRAPSGVTHIPPKYGTTRPTER